MRILKVDRGLHRKTDPSRTSGSRSSHLGARAFIVRKARTRGPPVLRDFVALRIIPAG